MPDGSVAPPSTVWWQPQNWSLRLKLGVVVLVPVVLALVLGVLRIADQADAANQLAKVDHVVRAQSQVSELLRQIEDERDIATVHVAGGRRGDVAAFDRQVAGVDGTAIPLAQAVDAALEESSGVTSAAAAAANSALAALGDIRLQVRGGNQPAAELIARYNGVVGPLQQLSGSLSQQVVQPEVSSLATGVRALVEARDEASLQHSLMVAALAEREPSREVVDLVQSSDARYDEALNQYRNPLSGRQLDTYGTYIGGPVEANRVLLVQQLTSLLEAPPADRAPVEQAPIDRALVDQTYADLLAKIDLTEGALRGDLASTALRLQNEASNAAGISSVILLLTLLLAALIVVLVARLLVRSLRTLRAAALDVANRRLPESVAAIRAGDGSRPTIVPVPLHTTDEVGQVARAFDAVHGQAVTLASEQAALQSNVSSMFVNLSRRSQALVERQLQLIEQLESNEQDADQLSNLFQLDHLATRMRRNSENLLVLAGTNLGRRNTAPVPLVDVLRAAVSEIEQYQRIVVQSPPTATVQGRVASDVVHLLAELLDNATNFSPPSSQVVMTTTRTPEGNIVVEIVDRGVGMIPQELTEANEQLSGPAAVDINVSRRMGLFVVGRLSNRHGIAVRLSSTPGGTPDAGVTATITLPGALIPSSEPSESLPRTGAQPAVAGAELPLQPAGGSTANGIPASLSSLVAGTDGTSSGSLFSAPATNGASSAAPPLPSRRPGSTLNPDGPPRAGDPAAQAAADQAAARAAEERLRAARRFDGPSGPEGPEGPADPAAELPSDEPAEERPEDEAGPLDEQPVAEETGETAAGSRSREQSDAPDESGERSGTGLAGAAAAGVAAAGAAAAFGRRDGSPEDTEAPAAEQGAPETSAAPAVPPVPAAAAERAEESGRETAAPSGPTPLPRRTPGTGPTLAEQYGMGRFAPGRPEQTPQSQQQSPQSPAANGTGPGGLPRRTARPSPQPQPLQPYQPQQPSRQEPQQSDPDVYGGSGQGRSAPRQFLAGLFGTGRPTTPPSSNEGDRPRTGGASPARPGAPIDNIDQVSATMPIPMIARQPQAPGAMPSRPAATPAQPTPEPTPERTVEPAAEPAAEATAEPATESPAGPDKGAIAGPVAVAGAAAAAAAAAASGGRDDSSDDQPAAQREAARGSVEDRPGESSTAQPGQRSIEQAGPLPQRTPGPRRIPQPAAEAAPAEAPAETAQPAAAAAPEQSEPASAAADPAQSPTTGRGAAAHTEAMPLIGAASAEPAAAAEEPTAAAAPAEKVAEAPEPARNGSNGNGTTAAVPGNSLFSQSIPATAVTPVGGDGPGIGETTPIFEEIASAWFRSNRSVPVTWDTDDQQASGEQAWQAPQPKPAPRPTPAMGNGASNGGPGPVPIGQQPPAQATPFSAQPVGSGPRQPEPVEPGFASAADEGWRVAEGVASERPDEMTSAGLPKRRPRARLVPGSAGSAVLAPPAAAGRSADNIRGRLSSYQRGVQQGRGDGSRPDAGTPFPGRPGQGDHDEESS